MGWLIGLVVSVRILHSLDRARTDHPWFSCFGPGDHLAALVHPSWDLRSVVILRSACDAKPFLFEDMLNGGQPFPDVRPVLRAPTSNCRQCDFSPANEEADSTPRDVIMSHMLGFPGGKRRWWSGVVPFVRSVRTASRCSIVILAGETVLRLLESNRPVLKFLVECGVSLVDCSCCLPRNLMEVFFFRFLTAGAFLRGREGMFDRVIITDMPDSICNGDPFTRAFNRSVISMTREESWGGIFYCPRARAVFRDGEWACSVVKRGVQVNNGLWLGSEDTVLRACEAYREAILMLMSRLDPKRMHRLKGNPFADQMFMVMAHGLDLISGRVPFVPQVSTDRNVNVQPHMWDGSVASMKRIVLGRFVFPRSTVKAGLIHGYPHWQRWVDAVMNACPPTFPLEDYVRGGNKTRAP